MSITLGRHVPVQSVACRSVNASCTTLAPPGGTYRPWNLRKTSWINDQCGLVSDDSLRLVQSSQVRSHDIPRGDHPYLHYKAAYYSELKWQNGQDYECYSRAPELHITCSQKIQQTPRFDHLNQWTAYETMPISTPNHVPDAENLSDLGLQDLTSLLENDDISYEFLRDIFHADDQISEQTSPKTLMDLDPPIVSEDQCPIFNTFQQSAYSQVENISATCMQPATTIQQHTVLGQLDTFNESESNVNNTNLSLTNSVLNFSMYKWASKHPRQWSTDDVLDWLYSSVEKEGVDLGRLRGEAFQDVNGVQLCDMTQEEFIEKEPEYGDLLYKSFKRLVDSMATVPSHPSPLAECQVNEQKVDSVSPTNTILLGTGLTVINATFHGGWIGSMPDIQKIQQSQQPGQTVTNSIVISSTNGSSLPLPASGPYRYPRPIASSFKPKRRPGRPRIRNLLTDAEIEQEKQKKRMKNQLLWEFLYDALKNPGYNPRLVKWENEMEGVFRFVQSEMMAHVWGNLKNNGNMNYEKLSRAMRHYYRRGILERVEGRRLVYKFSKTAIDKLKSRPNMT